MTPPVVVALALVAFCFFSALRDTLSEILFKDEAYKASPIFVLFVFSVTTQLVSGAVVSISRRRHWGEGMRDIILVNVYTLSAFLFYFLAISLPLGAALNS